MNALLIHGLVTGAPSIDLVNWTLRVELKFYLLLAPLVRARSAWLPAGYGAGLMLQPLLQGMHLDLPYLIIMAIGILLILHPGGRLGSASVAAQVGLLLAPRVAGQPVSDRPSQLWPCLGAVHRRLPVAPVGAAVRDARPDRGPQLSGLPWHLMASVLIMKLALLRFGWTPGVSC